MLKYFKTLIIAFIIIFSFSSIISMFGIFTGFYPLAIFYVFTTIYSLYKFVFINMKSTVSVVLVVFLTWSNTFLYDLLFGISTITQFALVYIVTGLLIIGVYFVWSIMSIKRKMTRELKKEIRLDAERRIAENPNCEATRILYEKENFY